MTSKQRSTTRRRTAAHAVELAFVAPIFFLFLFGILEYSRYLMTLQVMTNAAREGARYAVVTTNDANSSPTQDVQNWVYNYMAGQSVQLQAPTGGAFVATANVWVYTADPTATGPVYVNGTAGGTLLANANLPVNSSGTDVAWANVTYDSNGNPQPWLVAPYTNAGFNQTIAVVISGNYTPILPSFLLMGNTIPVSATAIMYSEAN
jgi:Flp pilus assembly protein TadG